MSEDRSGTPFAKIYSRVTLRSLQLVLIMLAFLGAVAAGVLFITGIIGYDLVFVKDSLGLLILLFVLSVLVTSRLLRKEAKEELMRRILDK